MTATPRRRAAWANAEESASPGSRAQIVSPPAGGVHVHAGSSDESADAMAAYRSPLQSAPPRLRLAFVPPPAELAAAQPRGRPTRRFG